MSAPTGDNENSVLSKFAPKRFREQPPLPAAERPYVTSAPTVPSSTHVHQDHVHRDQRTTAEFASWPESIPEPPPQLREDSAMALIGRITVVVAFAALVALLAIFAKPLWQDARALLNADSQTLQASKPSDRLTANNAPANSPLVPVTGIAAAPGAAPSASAQAQQAPPPISHPLGQEPAAPSASAQVQQAPPPISQPLVQERGASTIPFGG